METLTGRETQGVRQGLRADGLAALEAQDAKTSEEAEAEEQAEEDDIFGRVFGSEEGLTGDRPTPPEEVLCEPCETQEYEEEGAPARVHRTPDQPTAAQIEAHRDEQHIPYRNWV